LRRERLRLQQLQQAHARQGIEARYFVGEFAGRKFALLPELAQRMPRLGAERSKRRCGRRDVLALEVPCKFDSHIGSHRFFPIDGRR
jgi:hypothetical protein